MTLASLALTGGLHVDGLMDACDAIFSHQDREARLKILSDSHAGSFAVMGCVIILMAKTFLFAELLKLENNFALSIIPVSSRLGMALLLNNLPFAKSGGLAVTLGGLRKKSDNLILFAMILIIVFLNVKILACMIFCVVFWRRICINIFGGISGDLLGAFVELSEVIMLAGMVIFNCT